MRDRSAILAIAAGLSLVNHFPAPRHFESYEPKFSEHDAKALRKAQEKRDRKNAKRLMK